MNLYVVWLLGAGVLLLAQALLPGLFIVWFGLGAFAAGFVALIGAPLGYQLAVFFGVSVATLFAATLSARKGSPRVDGGSRKA